MKTSDQIFPLAREKLIVHESIHDIAAQTIENAETQDKVQKLDLNVYPRNDQETRGEDQVFMIDFIHSIQSVKKFAQRLKFISVHNCLE